MATFVQRRFSGKEKPCSLGVPVPLCVLGATKKQQYRVCGTHSWWWNCFDRNEMNCQNAEWEEKKNARKRKTIPYPFSLTQQVGTTCGYISLQVCVCVCQSEEENRICLSICIDTQSHRLASVSVKSRKTVNEDGKNGTKKPVNCTKERLCVYVSVWKWPHHSTWCLFCPVVSRSSHWMKSCSPIGTMAGNVESLTHKNQPETNGALRSSSDKFVERQKSFSDAHRSPRLGRGGSGWKASHH